MQVRLHPLALTTLAEGPAVAAAGPGPTHPAFRQWPQTGSDTSSLHPELRRMGTDPGLVCTRVRDRHIVEPDMRHRLLYFASSFRARTSVATAQIRTPPPGGCPAQLAPLHERVRALTYTLSVSGLFSKT